MTTYDFESGTVGNSANTTNTGLTGGAVTPGSGNAITFTATAANGAMALQFVVGGTNSCWAEAAAESGAGTTESKLLCIRLSSDGYNNGSTTTIWQQYAADNTTVLMRLGVTTGGALTISDQGTAHTATLVADVTGRYGNWIYVRLNLNSGSTTSNGAYEARYYTSLATAVGSPVASTNASNWNIGAGATFGKSRFGINSGQTTVGANGRLTVFDYVVNATGLSWIASPAAPSAPTANAGSDQYGQTGTTFTLSGSGTVGSSGGSINGYAWSLVSKSDASMATPTITTPSAQNTTVTGCDPGFYTFQLVVTQTGGGLSSLPDQVVVWVHPASGTAVKPYSVVKATGITREGTASSDVGALIDDDATTLLKWPDAPAGETVTIRWNPCGPSNPQFSFDLGKVGSGTINATINHYWEDGVTLLDGPYTASLGSIAPVAAGLDSDAITAIGSTLANRRQLVTVISAS